MKIVEALLKRFKAFEESNTLDAQDIEDALIAKFFEFCKGIELEVGESKLTFNEEESLEESDSLFEAIWGSLEGVYVYFRAVPYEKFIIEELDNARYKVQIEKTFEASIETSESEFAYTVEVPGLFGLTVLISKDNDGLIDDKALQQVIETMSPEIEALAELASTFNLEDDGEEVRD